MNTPAHDPAQNSVLSVSPLGAFPWKTDDPFLFCVFHNDAYPAGNEHLGPAAPLAGRKIGEDFVGKDGWRMYHGQKVPGFPQHPHRGFETVTIVRRGVVDHSDSLGATARYGNGDVQWLTAGKGILHCEMFPLTDPAAPNPLELFQIWLNLPADGKMVDPHFSMFWNDAVGTYTHADAEGRATLVRVIAGRLGDVAPPAPPPSSWAAREGADVAIWTVKMAPGARWTPPRPGKDSRRTFYFFRGDAMTIGGQRLTSHSAVRVRADADTPIENGPTESEILVLQGKPIGQPVVQYGPFVMNSEMQIRQAIIDYQRTQFGGWPWPNDEPVHRREEGHFAKHADGRIEKV